MNTGINTIQPAYGIEKINSNAEQAAWENLAAVGNALGKGMILLWQHHQLFVGCVANGRIQWLHGKKKSMEPEKEDKHLVRLRAFNDKLEYHFWRSGQHIQGRLRSDDGPGNTEYTDTTMQVRGVVAEPLRNSLDEYQKATAINIRTRNYIGYHPHTRQAHYVDSRFIAFTCKNGNT